MSSPAPPDTDRSAWLSDTALSALALEDQPFAAGATGGGAGEAFADDVTAEQLADIRQALITGDDLLLILGEAGAGKSTLLAQLAANSGLRIQCFSVEGGPRFSTRNLFMGMLEAFKVEPSEDLKQTLDELIPCLQAMVGNNKLCVIVLDDAQALTANELTTLLSGMLYINSRDESLLRIALAAPPEFEDRIPDLLPEGADLPYSSLSLEPFDARRAGDYLAFRLARAGRDDELPFDEEEIATFNERAGGRPGPLHAFAATALENAHGVPGTHAAPLGAHDEAGHDMAGHDLAGHHGAGYDAVDADLPAELREHRPSASGGFPLHGRAVKLGLGALAGLLIVGGLLLFRSAPEPGETEARYRVVEERKVETARETDRLRLLREKEEAREDGADSAPPADARTIARAPTTEDVAAPATPGNGAVPGSTDDTPDAAEPDSGVPANGPAVESDDANDSGDPNDPNDANDANDSGDAEPATAPSVASGEPSKPAAPESATSESPDSAAEPAPVGPEPIAAAPPEPDPEAGAASDADDSRPESAPDSEADASPEADTRDDAAPLDPEDESLSPVAPEPEPPESDVLESPNWVLVQDPGQFTVQMIASVERGSVEEFLARTDLPAPNSIFSFDRAGRTWHALVHGLYPSVAEARRAIERMPPPAQANQPWIRAVGRIQDALREQD